LMIDDLLAPVRHLVAALQRLAECLGPLDQGGGVSVEQAEEVVFPGQQRLKPAQHWRISRRILCAVTPVSAPARQPVRRLTVRPEPPAGGLFRRRTCENGGGDRSPPPQSVQSVRAIRRPAKPGRS